MVACSCKVGINIFVDRILSISLLPTSFFFPLIYIYTCIIHIMIATLISSLDRNYRERERSEVGETVPLTPIPVATDDLVDRHATQRELRIEIDCLL